MPFYKRYIDDGFGIWYHHPDPAEDARLWQAFQDDFNDWHGLEWEFVGPNDTVDFMDITMKIVNGKIDFTLFEKALNLYLYIPPKSAHPPGVLTGLISGNILRIHQLCSRDDDINDRLRIFFRRLRHRGYSSEALLPIFQKAVDNAKKYLRTSPESRLAAKRAKAEESKRRVFLHLPYHPNDPPSSTVQRLWREHMLHPIGLTPLNHVENDCNERIPIDRLTIAYSRAPNFGNMFSVRKIQKHPGPNVSSFIG